MERTPTLDPLRRAKPDFPINYPQHCRKRLSDALKAFPKSYDNLLAEQKRAKMQQVKEIQEWLNRRIETVDEIELGNHKDHKRIQSTYATQLNIQDMITAYRKLGGLKRYPEILDELTQIPGSVRILHRNSPQTLAKMYNQVKILLNEHIKKIKQ